MSFEKQRFLFRKVRTSASKEPLSPCLHWTSPTLTADVVYGQRGFFPANLFPFFHFESFLIIFDWLEKSLNRKPAWIEVIM